MTTDAFHVTAPHPDGDGMARAMRAALARGGIAPSDVGYVNAHGTATLQNDRIEAAALRPADRARNRGRARDLELLRLRRPERHAAVPRRRMSGRQRVAITGAGAVT